MRNLAKYFLALTVMGTGFYAAQQHRRPDREDSAETASARKSPTETSAEPSANRVRLASAARSTDPLPVAALTDVDRVPLLGADRTSTSPGANQTEASTVTKQPTVRRDSSSEQASPVEPPPNSAPETAKQDTKRPVDANSAPKRQDPKKKPPAKTRDKDFQPPDLAHEYQPYAEHLESVEQRVAEGPDTPRQTGGKSKPAENAQAASQASNRSTQGPPDAPLSRHCILEGDTLRRLAEKYLGSRDRYLDIFNANQDVLFDPQLIPIGVEIVIPDKTIVMAQAPSDSTMNDDTSDDTGPGRERKATPDQSGSDSASKPRASAKRQLSDIP